MAEGFLCGLACAMRRYDTHQQVSRWGSSSVCGPGMPFAAQLGGALTLARNACSDSLPGADSPVACPAELTQLNQRFLFLSGPPSACSRRDGGLKGTLGYKADLAVLSPRQGVSGRLLVCSRTFKVM